MHMLIQVVVLILSVPSSRSFSWTTRRSFPEEKVSPHNAAFENGLGPDEIAMVVRDVETLESYTRRPDCFRRAAGLIRMRCGELDIDEDERIRAAISMTLCELATAKHSSTPLECASFLSESESPKGFQEGSPSNCVEALSRSTQHWSSYSGYLREVPQLCYAFRRWNDIDTAKDIYKNATIEKLSLLRLLRDREQRLEHSQQDSERFMRDMWDALVDLRSSATAVDAVSDILERKLHDGFKQSMHELRSVIATAYMRSEEDQLRTVVKVDSAIESVVDRHIKSLDALLPPLEQALLLELERVFALSRDQQQGVLDIVDTTHTRLAAISMDFEAMHQTVARLASAALQTTTQLDAHIRAADLAQARQREASASAHTLADALADLAGTAHAEIGRINGTAAAVRAGMLASARGPGEWAGWLLALILRADPVHVDGVLGLPVVRALGVCARVVGWLLRAGVSSVMSAVFLVLSTRRWLSRPRGAASCARAGLDSVLTVTHLQDQEITCSAPYANTLPPSVFPSGPSYVSSRRPRARASRIPDRLCNPPADRLL